jgi:PAS domain S-box-containing protein
MQNDLLFYKRVNACYGCFLDGGMEVRATHYFRCLDWRDGAGVFALLLVYVFGCTHWFVYALFGMMFLLFRYKRKPACTTAIFDTFPIGVLLFDQAARCCYANQKWQACSGATLQALLGDGWLSTIHPEDHDRVLAAQKSMRSGVLLNVEHRILRTDGQISWVASVMLPMHDFSNVSYQLLLFDLNELKQQEIQMATLLAEQKQIKEELESILSSSNDPIAAMDMKFNFTVFNQGYAALFYDLYHIQVAKKDCFLQYELNSVDDRSNLITFWGRVLQGESFVERSALQGQSNQVRVFDLSFSPQFNSAGEQVGAVNVLHDVTLSAQTELALSRSEELFKVATQSSLDAIYVLEVIKDKSWNIVDFLVLEVNPNGFDFLNLHENKLPNYYLHEKLQEINSDHLYDLCCDVFTNKKSFVRDEENLNPYYDGAWLQVQIVAVSTGVVLTITDISQRKKIALAMATFSGLQQAILDSAGSAIIVTDLNHTIRLFNRAAELMLGYQASELIAQETPALFHQPSSALPLMAEFVATIGMALTADLDIFSLQAKRYIQSDWIYQHRDGHIFPVELTMNVVRDQQGEITGYMGDCE